MSKFAIPRPVEYNPRSVLYRYRFLLILFVLIFIGAITEGRHLIREGRNRPLPLAPVFFVDTAPAAPEEPAASASSP